MSGNQDKLGGAELPPYDAAALSRLLHRQGNALIICKDEIITYANLAGAGLLGFAYPKDTLGLNITEFFHQDYRALSELGLAELAENEGVIPVKLVQRHGRPLDVEIRISLLFKNDGRTVIVEARDITQHLKAARELQQREQWLQGIVDSVAHGIITLSESGIVTSFNRAAEEIFGYTAKEIINGNINFLLAEPISDLMSQNEKGRNKRKGLFNNYHSGIRKGGSTFPLEMALRKHIIDGKVSITGVIRDVTDQERAELELEHYITELEFNRQFFEDQAAETVTLAEDLAAQKGEVQVGKDQMERLAHLDALTNLPNRRHFTKFLDRALESAVKAKGKVGLLIIDLDRFKKVNDTMGHERGDQVLKITAQELKGCVRDQDLAARIGGDEFAVVAVSGPEGGHKGFARIAQRILDRLQVSLKEPEGQPLCGVSIGCAVYPDDVSNSQDLMKLADKTMYSAKQSGGNRIAHASG